MRTPLWRRSQPASMCWSKSRLRSTTDAAEKVVEAGRQAGLVVMTGHVLRYHPAFETLAAMVAAGELGALRYIHTHRLGAGQVPRRKRRTLGYCAARPVADPGAHRRAAGNDSRRRAPPTLDHLSDFAHLHMSFPGGISSHVFVSRLNPYRERRLTVIGEKAMAVFEDTLPWDQKLAVYDHPRVA